MAAPNTPNKQDLSALQPLLAGDGLLDHFHLPQGLIRFLRRYQTLIWTAIICVTAITVSHVSYTSYIAHRNTSGAEAFENALTAPVDQREAQLLAVLAEHGKTPAAGLAAVTLSNIKQTAGEWDKAIFYLEDAHSRLSPDSSIRPMLLGKLAALYADHKNYDKAMTLYTELAGIEQFTAEANAAMGRICEQSGKTAEAISYYQKYLATPASAVTGQINLNSLQRDVVQFRISQLQKQ